MPKGRGRVSRRQVRRALAVGTILAMLIAMFSVDYTVRRGDTLGKIAREQGVSLSDLAEANNIANPNLIRIGQVLVIPGQEDAPDIVHVVVRGDTLGKIARQYGASVTALIEANGIANANLIRIGQSITVPGTGGSGNAGTSGTGNSGDSEPPPAPDPNVRSGAHHIVTGGDTLQSIAQQHAVPADQIARANGIVNEKIYVGTRLFLDGPSYVADGSGEGESTYTVVRGDRLGDIAAAHGTNISTLVRMNNLTNVNLIRVGQSLKVPGGSSWVCPVEGSWFFNGWGFPRGGGTRWHEGIDMFAARGTPVLAPVSGTVKQVVGSVGGNQVTLSGNDGTFYLGSHLDAFGESGAVNAGDIIGYVGTSGNAADTSPHLHFAMYRDGIAINPYPSLIGNGC